MSDPTPTAHSYVFHGIRCEVYTNENTLKYYPSMPWRFRLWKPDGTEVRFFGIPNYCGSRRSAIMRVMARCKWVSDGSYDLRYK